MVNISQYTVVLLDDPHQPDVFQLTDDTRGNTYSVTLLVFACFQKRSIICICHFSVIKIIELSQVFFLGIDHGLLCLYTPFPRYTHLKALHSPVCFVNFFVIGPFEPVNHCTRLFKTTHNWIED